MKVKKGRVQSTGAGKETYRTGLIFKFKMSEKCLCTLYEQTDVPFRVHDLCVVLSTERKGGDGLKMGMFIVSPNSENFQYLREQNIYTCTRYIIAVTVTLLIYLCCVH
jgi:hypothetical protein